jgi:hypothetical protein
MHEQVELCTFKAHFDDSLAKALHEERSFLMKHWWIIIASMLISWLMAQRTVTNDLK